MRKRNLWCLGLLFLVLGSCSPSPTPVPTVRIRLAQDPESLHPLSYGNAHALQLLNLVYQSLLTVNLSTEKVEPLLAIALPTVTRKDSLSFFTFRIRPEARWDNGQPVTAQDVAFSLKLVQGPLLENERFRAHYGFIRDIHFSTDSLSYFTLECSGYTPEMNLLTGDFFVFPSYQFDPEGLIQKIPFALVKSKRDSLAHSPAFKKLADRLNQASFARDTALVKGSGPYQLVSWQSGQAVFLQKKKDWWGANVKPTPAALQVLPERILYQIIPDDAAAVMALKAKQVDLMENIPLVSFQEMKQDQGLKSSFNFFGTTTYDLVFLGINGFSPLLQDKETRQALALLLPVSQLIKTVQGGYATPTAGVIHPKDKAFYNPSLKAQTYDPQKAQVLLKKAGWRRNNKGWSRTIDGVPSQLRLRIMHRAGNAAFENLALLFQQNAKALGIPVQIQGVEGSQISDKLNSRDYHLYIRTLSGNPFSYNFIPIWHTSEAVEGGRNVTNFGNPYTDRLLEKIADEENLIQKASLLREFQAQMQTESNLIFLYFEHNTLAISSQIINPVVSSLKPGYDVQKFKLKN